MSSSKTSPGLNTQAFWLILARAIGFVFLLAMPIVMVRVFDKEQFGLYKQVFVVVSTAVALCQFGVLLSVFYFLPRMPDKRGAVVLNVVVYHTIVGLAVCALFWVWPGFLKLILGGTGLMPYSRLIGAIVLTWLFASFLEFIPTANADVTWSTSFIIGSQIARTALLTGLALAFRTVEAVLYGALAHGILQSIALLWYLSWRFPSFWRHFDRAIATEQLRYAAPFGLYGILSWAQDDMHNYLVANRFSASDFAIYAVGTADLPFGGILRDSVNAVLMPRVSQLHQEGKTEEILNLLMRAWRRLAVVLLPATALLLVLGRDFIATVYTPRYISSWPIFALNLTALGMAVFLTDAVVRSHAERRFFFMRLRIFNAIIQIPVSLFMMKMFGMIGALIGLLLVSLFEQGVTICTVLRLLRFTRRDLGRLSGILGFAIASALAALVTWAFRLWLTVSSPKVAFVLGSLVYLVAYIIAVIAMKLPDADERELVNRYSVKFLRIRLPGGAG